MNIPENNIVGYSVSKIRHIFMLKNPRVSIYILILLATAVGALFNSNDSNLDLVEALPSIRRKPILQFLVPLYVYPQLVNGQSNWLPLVEAAKKVPVVAIINPNSGPGGKPNSDYAQGLKILQQGGVKTIGYVATNYGKRSIDQVKADVDVYNTHFGVQGIFLDEGASDKAYLNHYAEIYRYIKSKKRLQQVVINPGNQIDEAYLSKPVADQAVVFENTGKEWPGYRASSYLKKYAPQRFAMMLHHVTDRDQLKSYIDLAVQRNVGYLYITNDADSNPWDSLPSYWQAEVEMVRSKNAQRN
jgi:Spherulation-specific family 4